MKVIKRDGRAEPVAFEKITGRLKTLAALAPPLERVDIPKVAQHACAAVHDGIRTETLDEVTADAAAALSTEHPEYSQLAARILVSNLQKNTKAGVREVFVNVSDEIRDLVDAYHEELDAMLDFSRDYKFDFFGFRTLQKAYLMKGERPQHVYLRVALCIWGSDLARVRETYDALSTHLFTHASPTLFNAGTKTQQLASCFLLGVHTDSLDGIFEAFHKAASISKYGGGIGFHVSSIRSKGSPIKSTDGTSDGLVPMLKVLNEIANYVNQSGKRKGSVAVYIEPHHADIMQVLDLKRNQGDEHLRARDLFYALWISDLFMERVERQETWSLFDPGTAPGLEDVWGDEYRELYERYEREGRAVRQLPAVDVWFAALRLQIETGVPYMVYKDSANAKSNQRNVGTIKCSNLCVAGETSVLTKDGHRAIESLCDREVDVWNGEEWSRVTVRLTNQESELMRVSLSDGTSVDCTPYHKFYVDDGVATRETMARDLLVGDRMISWIAPVIRSEHGPRFPHARMHGFFCGIQEDAGLTAMFPEDMPAKYAVPTHAPLQDRLDWIGGLIDATVSEYKFGLLCIEVSQYDFLKSVQFVLTTMGVRSSLTGKSLVVTSAGVSELVRLGLSTRRVELRADVQSSMLDVYVERVERTGRVGPTYCFDEPKRHMGVFNGILTGNCSEIIEYTAEDEIAVCNLASISLPAFVRDTRYDYAALHRVTKIVARNLNRVIDVTFYPLPEAEKSNKRHRPIGIGVQGLADVFFMLKVPFDSPEAAEINRKIFATIYHAAVETSVELAGVDGPYDSFRGSPASLGKLQFDLWDVAPVPMYDWDLLKTKVCAVGMRNSLLVAPMPTASTSQLLGNTEAFEPVTSNLYSRTTLAGTFTVVNKYLLEDLIERGLWTPELKHKLVAAEGSVQDIEEIPEDLKRLYKTAYELSMKTLIDLAAGRGAYVDQSMSLNLFVAAPTFRKLSSMHFYAWKKGLKTGQYYLRSRPASGATKITVDAVECLACSG